MNKIALKLPKFCNENPRLLFARVEANFKLLGITQKNTKYSSLIALHNQETMLSVADLVHNHDLEKSAYCHKK